MRVLGGIRGVAECRRVGRMGVGVRGKEKEGSCGLNFYFLMVKLGAQISALIF